ncbi:ShlB/FhaC/HecB family hemolysin secretion/activation protein [Pseudonocardia sp. TMWB2A]|uniref:ShlB/FhaC/HecB family hemolysin secretion/activation protein n=1 Tax=Pseudonocardia sp. TMWB2A TaxID=687430 RepID=UPI00307FC66C
MRIRILVAGISAAALLPTGVQAQQSAATPPDAGQALPSVAQASVAGQPVAVPPVTDAPPAPPAPPAEDAPDISAPAPTGATGQASPSKLVDILNYRIEGNTVLSVMDVEKAVLPFLGPQRPVADVENARAALQAAYREKGYETVAVEIPDQDVRGGIVQLDVIEMRVGRLRVADAKHISPERIKNAVPSLKEGGVPNYQDVAKEMAAINRSPDRTISPTLMAGDAPGTVDVVLQVDDQSSVHGSLELNDRHSARSERLRVAASARYANLFQRGHSVGIQGQFAPEDPGQSWILSASYVAPIQGTPWTIVGYGVHSESDVAAIGGVGVLGSGNIFGLRGIYSFTTGEGTSPLQHQITAGIDYKDFEENLVLGSDTAKTPITYIPFSLAWAVSEAGDKDSFEGGIGLHFGIRGFGADERAFRDKRWNASASWHAIRLNTAYRHRFAEDWSASARIDAQFAGMPLISNEQFSAGGLESVRGYLESQELGDDGVSGQFQIETPSLIPLSKDQELRLFAFADGALLRIYDPLSTQAARIDLASTGAGLRLRFLERFNASVLMATPLLNKGGATFDIDRKFRIQFRLWTEF